VHCLLAEKAPNLWGRSVEGIKFSSPFGASFLGGSWKSGADSILAEVLTKQLCNVLTHCLCDTLEARASTEGAQKGTWCLPVVATTSRQLRECATGAAGISFYKGSFRSFKSFGCFRRLRMGGLWSIRG
jgi:hypothetical protein